MEQVGDIIYVRTGQGAAGGQGCIGFGQWYCGTGDGGGIVGTVDGYFHRAGSAVNRGNGEGFTDALPHIQAVKGTVGGVSPIAAGGNTETAGGAGDVGQLEQVGDVVYIRTGQGAAGGQGCIGFGQGNVGTGYGGGIVGTIDGNLHRARSAVSRGNREGFTDTLTHIQAVKGTGGGVGPHAAGGHGEAAGGAGDIGRLEQVGAVVNVGTGQGAAGNQGDIAFRQCDIGTGYRGSIIGTVDGYLDRTGSAVYGGNREGFTDAGTHIQVVESTVGGVSPIAAGGHAETTGGPGDIGQLEQVGGVVNVDTRQGTAGAQGNIGFGQCDVGTGYDSGIVGTINGYLHRTGGAVGTGNGEGFTDTLTHIHAVKGTVGGVGPDPTGGHAETTGGPGGRSNLEQVGTVVNVCAGQGAAGNQGDVAFRKCDVGTGYGSGIVGAGDGYLDRAGGTVSTGNRESLADTLPHIQVVKGTVGGIGPKAAGGHA